MADTTAGLRRRIELAEELRSVTGTMKSLAAVSIHQYERSVDALRDYAEAIERGLQILLRNRPELVVEPPQGAAEPTLVVVFGSARGLCGPLNRQVASEARAFVDLLRSVDGTAERSATRTERSATRTERSATRTERSATRTERSATRTERSATRTERSATRTERSATRTERSVTIAACGARVVAELEAVGLAPGEVVDAPVVVDTIGDRVDELLVVVDRWREAAGPGRVFLILPRPRSGSRQYDPAVVPLLPLDWTRFARLAEAPWPTRVLPTWRGDWREVFAGLTRQLLFVDLHGALAETQVCAQRARLAAMQAAEESIGQRLAELSIRFHRHRQAAITGELLDVVSGFEVVGGQAGSAGARSASN